MYIPGSFANGFQALEDGDVRGAVGVRLAALVFFSGNESLPVLTESPDARSPAPGRSGLESELP